MQNSSIMQTVEHDAQRGSAGSILGGFQDLDGYIAEHPGLTLQLTLL